MKTPSNAVLVAKVIRSELKKHNIKAKVKVEGLDTIYIETKNIHPADRHKLNELKTTYDLNNYNPKLLQVRYIFITNEIDEEIYQKALDYIFTTYANERHWDLAEIYEKGNHVTPDMIDAQKKITIRMKDLVHNSEKFWETL